jgi:peptidoglycan/LPS O-acetylase OafA/YrhL
LWLLTSTVAYASGWDLLSMLTIPEEAPYFTAGIAFYLIYRYGPNLHLWGLVGFSWLVALNKLGHVVSRQAKHMGAEGAADLPVAAAVVTLFFLIMAAVATRRMAVGWRWLTYAGAVTYPLYLLHEYIGWTLIHHLRGWLSPALLTTALILAMIAFSWLVHRYVERPAAAWLRVRLTRARQAPAAAEGPAPQPAPEPRAQRDHDMTVELELVR